MPLFINMLVTLRQSREGGSFFIIRLLKSIFFIEFHRTFYISYKIQTNYVYHYCIYIRQRQAGWTSFFRAPFISFHTHASLLTVFVCFFILFHFCCSHAPVFGKRLVHELPISYSHTERYLLFSECNCTCTMFIRAKIEMLKQL